MVCYFFLQHYWSIWSNRTNKRESDWVQVINGGIFKTRKRHKPKEISEDFWNKVSKQQLLWATNWCMCLAGPGGQIHRMSYSSLNLNKLLLDMRITCQNTHWLLAWDESGRPRWPVPRWKPQLRASELDQSHRGGLDWSMLLVWLRVCPS